MKETVGFQLRLTAHGVFAWKRRFMTDGIIFQESPTIPVQDQPDEIVERKGKGHPDTICDAGSVVL